MKKLIATGVILGSVLVGSLALAGPASAKNQCGALGFTRTGVSTGQIVQSCDTGTQVTYKVKCLLPGFDNTYTRYFNYGQSLVVNVRCNGNNIILGASYSLG
ncbi:hypothetical protein EDF64_10143 [Curtobacterium flaccumfaciens]|uniref:Uncharacterized protein n=1 Tax=Curtobacterium flaccumfaciens TaxID=2035 RepID=A0A4R6DMV3_9MICO|nr:hypothetical protein [Curtobacterium flaccumfaciens]TDN46187.1 hypothetical protein EDF64_10143 [Curtobacterium flaccumfaciens]